MKVTKTASTSLSQIVAYGAIFAVLIAFIPSSVFALDNYPNNGCQAKVDSQNKQMLPQSAIDDALELFPNRSIYINFWSYSGANSGWDMYVAPEGMSNYVAHWISGDGGNTVYIATGASVWNYGGGLWNNIATATGVIPVSYTNSQVTTSALKWDIETQLGECFGYAYNIDETSINVNDSGSYYEDVVYNFNNIITAPTVNVITPSVDFKYTDVNKTVTAKVIAPDPAPSQLSGATVYYSLYNQQHNKITQKTIGQTEEFTYKLSPGKYTLYVAYVIPTPYDPETYDNKTVALNFNVIDNENLEFLSANNEACTDYICTVNSKYKTCDLADIGCHLSNFGTFMIDGIQGLFIPDSDLIQQDLDQFNTDNHNLGDIIALPITTIGSLVNKPCSAITLPLPFMSNKSIELPCMATVYSSSLGAWWTMIQLVITGVIAYWITINTIAIVKGIKDPDNDKVEVFDL